MKRILLAGGGTGGHIYPLIAVAERLTGCECRYFGPKGPWTAAIGDAGIPISHIAGAKLRRYFSAWNLVDGPKFAWSIMQALAKVALFRPHATFSKGGPGALPVLFACHLYGVPIVIHESDSVPGLVSRMTGKWARIVELGWQAAEWYFPGKKTHVVGVPLRNDVRNGTGRDQKDAKRALGLKAETPVILAIGGSQGSERMNEMVFDHLAGILARYELIHQMGTGTHAAYMERWETLKRNIPPEHAARYRPYEYLGGEMPDAYAASDCVITRAGSAIFEIAAYGKPAILVPLPEAANGHQAMNAELYAKTGAAMTLMEGEESRLEGMIVDVMENPERKRLMEEAARRFAKPDAAERIAEDILEMAKG